MSININSLTPSQVQSSSDDTQVKRTSEETQPQQETGKSSTSDTVSLSDGAVQLGKLENTVANLPVVDTQRVEQLKQAIENGSYEVDPAKVADKLMQFEHILKPEG
jgi:negative regulator of flagellin synthesis FlgM